MSSLFKFKAYKLFKQERDISTFSKPWYKIIVIKVVKCVIACFHCTTLLWKRPLCFIVLQSYATKSQWLCHKSQTLHTPTWLNAVFSLDLFFCRWQWHEKKKDQFDPYLLFQFRFSVCIKLVHTPMRLQNCRYWEGLAGLYTTIRPMYDRILKYG